MRDGVDSTREAGDDSETVVDQLAYEACGPRLASFAWLASAHHRHAAGIHQLPSTLEVQKFYGGLGIAKAFRILTGAVDPDSEMFDAAVANSAERESRVFLNIGIGYEVGGDRACVGAENLALAT
jgi:hypothetical protein